MFADLGTASIFFMTTSKHTPYSLVATIGTVYSPITKLILFQTHGRIETLPLKRAARDLSHSWRKNDKWKIEIKQELSLPIPLTLLLLL